MFIAALFILAKLWKQSRCIKKILAKKFFRVSFISFSNLSVSIQLRTYSRKILAFYSSLKPLLSTTIMIFLLFNSIVRSESYSYFNCFFLLKSQFLLLSCSFQIFLSNFPVHISNWISIGLVKFKISRTCLWLLPQVLTCLHSTISHPGKWYHYYKNISQERMLLKDWFMN
jgi:hypothetical protein